MAVEVKEQKDVVREVKATAPHKNGVVHRLTINDPALGVREFKWHVDNEVEVGKAKAEFDTARQRGMAMVAKSAETGEEAIVHEFSPAAVEITAIPQIAGG